MHNLGKGNLNFMTPPGETVSKIGIRKAWFQAESKFMWKCRNSQPLCASFHKYKLSRLCSKLFKVFLPGIVSLAIHSTAQAQRGFGYATQQTPAVTPLTGYPGFFDANVAEKNGFVFDLPTFAGDYGVSENITVGSNALLAIPWLSSVPMFYGKARYRFFSDKQLASALTVYAGFLTEKNKYKDHTSRSTYTAAVVSNTTTFYLSDKTTLTGFLFGALLYAQVGTPGNLEYTKANFNFSFAGLNLQHWVTDWLGPQIVAFTTLHYSAEVDSTGASLSADNGVLSASKNFVVVRGLLELRAGNWLLSPGGALLLAPGAGRTVAVPYFSGTVKW